MDSPGPQHRYDPRLGDEEKTENHDQEVPNHRVPKHVRLSEQIPRSASPNDKEGKGSSSGGQPEPARLRVVLGKVAAYSPFDFKWIPNNFTWSKLKIVIRCAIMAWVSLMFMIIPRLAKLLGQASFLIMIAAFLNPPRQPFIAVLEQELIFLGLITTAWAWSCLGIFLANLARTHTDHNASPATIITGRYIEAGPTVIMAVFIFIGVAVMLFIRSKKGPGPFLLASIFSCICIDLTLTTAVLYPYPFYLIGSAILLPLSFHAALSILSAAIIFPSTITAQYTNALAGAMDPLNHALTEHRTILKTLANAPSFPIAVKRISGLVSKAEGGLAPASASLRLMKRDIVWGRFPPSEVGGLQWWVRRLVMRANGMGIFFTLIGPTRERFPVTPLPSHPSTPVMGNTPIPSRPMTPSPLSPAASRPSSPPPFSPPGTPRNSRPLQLSNQSARRRRPNSSQDRLHTSFRQTLSRQLHIKLGKHAEDTHDRHLHFSLLTLAHSLAPTHVSTASSLEASVGVFESQRYLTLEATRLSHHDSPEATNQFMSLLGESCDDLLGACSDSLKGAQGWIREVRRGNFGSRERIEKARGERLKHLMALKEQLGQELECFRKQSRHRVLDPYRSAFDPRRVGSPEGAIEPPPHRYLFHCYVYQFHLTQFGLVLTDLLDEIIRMEQEYKRARLWTPSLPIRKWLQWGPWDLQSDIDRSDDEDPDVIPGIPPEWLTDLGMASRRDPDALPPSNIFEEVMHWIHEIITGLGGGNSLYALKAALLTIILCIPSFLKSTASFAYAQRFVWGIFMGQLSLARFRGDTTFGLVARVMATFLGGICGMVMWYISTGNGRGSYYGLAAVCAVCFPLFYYGRLYWPGPPMTNTIFFVTTALVFGYSWQDTHSTVAFHYYGWGLAWRRFVLVTAGVTAAFIFSFLPPSTTLRRYQRTMLSTTVAELGSVYCSIVSFANTHGRHSVDKGEINQSLMATRIKLKRSLVLKANIIYEFSLRGKWPSKRYQKILELQLQIAYLLSHLMSVVEHLEPAWSRAFLRRTRFLDSDFQGDVLAVISMISTSLRTGNPLPQISPCPLLDRFMIYTHGLNVIRQEADDDYGLPRTMTIDTLENEQYLCFSVGVTTAFGIVMRLDKLMLATKELVGEQYHIHGIGLSGPRDFLESASIRPSKDA
ncbi:hypothetical protein SCP_0116800 [Sparassis crispa]|uniref:ER transporter 6TM N-terminal domain-containing protein n=1 Tax=Sparassis crispa TaxID=139825 RepID=A0A401G9E9_9APHY|nr:hypothetical protein SCP_0116800 [Sparassis crispa]GBE78787.1 hypothetical protein SCP_0116800 [Sparassis crispa]